MFSIVQSIILTIGIITGVAKVSCVIVLLKSASSDDHIFLTLLRHSFEILLKFLFRGAQYSTFLTIAKYL